MATYIYTPKRWEEELSGVAEGASMRPGTVKRINLLPELTRAACTILGAWGPAT